MPNGSKNWVFTLNNPTPAEKLRIADVGANLPLHNATYLVVGRETSDSGTAHLQGYVSFTTRRAMAHIKTTVFQTQRLFLAYRAGTAVQAAEYCKKDLDYDEYGDPPVTQQGKRTDWDRFREYIEQEAPRYPTDAELFEKFPGIFARYRERVHEFIRLILGPLDLVADQLPHNGWQQELVERVEQPAHPREIDWVVDPEGNSGKTWIAKYMMSKHPNKAQVLRIGKRDDLACAIDETKSIFIFDIPRSQMEFFQYSVVESLKDQMVFSPKYGSRTKILSTVPHVIVLSNEPPDQDKLTYDRFNFININ
jgi:hypothetical protein